MQKRGQCRGSCQIFGAARVGRLGFLPRPAEHPDYELAQTMLPMGCGAVFNFELLDGREAGRVFIESLNVFSHLANVGDAKSLVIHPASDPPSRG